ncbi:transcriptional regulator [Alphaproteobacteria bacterium]|nr:transcriptional regulator [Alphaproteobacteria bacterium]
MTIKTIKFNILDHLDTEEKIKDYLAVVFEDADPKMIAIALGDVARARGMAKVARKAKMSRGSLYRSLSEEGGNPRLDTLLKVISALGMKLPGPVVASA